ncbi:MAG: hypothetical protein ACI9Z3_002261, partial [Roseivirga sp.]
EADRAAEIQAMNEKGIFPDTLTTDEIEVRNLKEVGINQDLAKMDKKFKKKDQKQNQAQAQAQAQAQGQENVAGSPNKNTNRNKNRNRNRNRNPE